MKYESLNPKVPITLTLMVLAMLSYGQSKITLKEYDDPEYSSGYKSIVFEYEEDVPGHRGEKRKASKEFDIEANNPFLKMGFQVSKPGSGMRKLHINKSSVERLRSQFGADARNNKSTSKDEVEFGTTGAFVSEEENHVVLSYNLFLHDGYGEYIDRGGRFAAIYILDKKGNLVKEIDHIPTDAYGTAISENGKYLAYGFGERLHGTIPGNIKSGFRIVDMETDQIHYESEAGYVEGVFPSRDMLVIAYIDETGQQKIVLDALGGSIYGPTQFSLTLGRFKFMQTDGTVIELKDLPKIK